MVDENRWREEADRYDYWYVPAYFLGDEKLCEGAKDKETVLGGFPPGLGDGIGYESGAPRGAAYLSRAGPYKKQEGRTAPLPRLLQGEVCTLGYLLRM